MKCLGCGVSIDADYQVLPACDHCLRRELERLGPISPAPTILADPPLEVVHHPGGTGVTIRLQQPPPVFVFENPESLTADEAQAVLAAAARGPAVILPRAAEAALVAGRTVFPAAGGLVTAEQLLGLLVRYVTGRDDEKALVAGVLRDPEDRAAAAAYADFLAADGRPKEAATWAAFARSVSLERKGVNP